MMAPLSAEKSIVICGIGGMVDALDLGSSVYGVRVRVPYPAPTSEIDVTLLLALIDGFVIYQIRAYVGIGRQAGLRCL